MVNDFRQLEVYKASVLIAKDVYSLVKKFPIEEKYGLSDQLRRSASSIGANIAEGFGRYHYRDKLVFFYNARGSLFETMHFLELASEIGYLERGNKEVLINRLKDLSVRLNNFIAAIGKSKV